MSDDTTFQFQADYEAPLLRLLYRLPGGQGEAADVCRLFEEEHGDRIPQVHRENFVGNQMQWEKNIHWSRFYLKERGFVDAPERGMWRITEAGRRWVEENPDANRLRLPKRNRSKGPGGPHGGGKDIRLPDITLEMLELTRKSMPSEQFRQVWGPLYDQLRAEELAKAITVITPSDLGRRVQKRLNEIHDFLRGKVASPPSAEVLCDWIHFCYALELYREASALLDYVHEDEVDPAIYKRAKRVASLCRSKLAG